MDDLLSPLVYVLVIGGIAGYFIGYLVRKISRFAVVIGVFAFLLIFLSYTRVISLNFSEIGENAKRIIETISPLGLTALASSAPFVGSFVVGLVFGLRRG